MKTMLTTTTTILLMLLPLVSHANYHRFYRDGARGWYYFEQQERIQEQQSQEQQQIYEQEKIQQQLKKVQQELEFRRNRLVMQPTVAHARAYIAYQNAVMEQASDVSKAWQMALVRYPELDTRVTDPVGQQASRIKYEEEEQMRTKKIASFARHFTLMLFFQEGCRYSDAFEPVLARFAEEHGFTVRRISLADPLARVHAVSTTPTLLAYNPEHDLTLPVASGLVTEEELSRHISLIYDHLTKGASS